MSKESRLIPQGTTAITLLGGKYTVLHENGLNLRAERYGQRWIDGFVTGENLILAMAQRIEELEAGINKALSIVNGAPPQEVSFKCKSCGGSGISHSDADCSFCEGKSFINA